ncbi:uncharacterized protein [Periplaneta americana]|uniref:uncharacterized protein n=1 Tax=Periplaneta americana TaxID=6978 RepID=UPI0037E9C8E0
MTYVTVVTAMSALQLLVCCLCVVTLSQLTDNAAGVAPFYKSSSDALQHTGKVTRIIRSTPRPTSKSKRPRPKCCADSPVIPESYKKFVEQCNLNFTQDDEEKLGHESLKQDCQFSCLGEKLGLVNDQGYIKDDEAFLDYVQDQYVHDSVKDQARYSAYDCMLWANRAAKWMWMSSVNDIECNQALSLATRCIRTEVILKCPAEYKIDSEECDEYVEYLKKAQKENYEQK